MTRFSRAEERIINRIQEDIPLALDPFGRIADELSMPESELLETVARLKEKRIVRNISAIFNAHRLGYHSSLVAFSVAEEDVDAAVAVINAHPGVSHNYLRDHRYNIWFTLAVDMLTPLEETAAVLARMCRAADHLILRNEKLYKIGFMLRMGDDARMKRTMKKPRRTRPLHWMTGSTRSPTRTGRGAPAPDGPSHHRQAV
jgi:DNA-binding Lrp family transcriptional regulator